MQTVQIILFGFLLSLSVLSGAESDCNFHQNLEAGQTDSQGGRFSCGIEIDSNKIEIPSNNAYNDECKCGWKKVTKIIGGMDAGVNEFPMMSGLVDLRDGTLFCGATIIAQQYVLTAAHCVENKYYTDLAVIVGEHDVNTGAETNATKLFRLMGYLIHPKYYNNPDAYDLALCKIDGIIQYSSAVGPACLPFQHKYYSFDNDIVTELGWGLLEFGGAKATKLQKVEVRVENLGKCKETYPEVTANNICTYTPGKDSCQMDSGGPLLWQDPRTHNLVLVGTIASGAGCGSEPGVATRTTAFVDWIVLNTPDAEYCRVE